MDMITAYLHSKLSYIIIFVLMTIEGSFIPFPSEIVVPPASFFAQKGELNLSIVVLCSLVGTIFGSCINYFLAQRYGSSILDKCLHKKFFKSHFFFKSEVLFKDYRGISLFIGYLIPGIRQYISIPAGLYQYPFRKFFILTSFGSSIWIGLLTFAGVQFSYHSKQCLNFIRNIHYTGFILGITFIIIVYYSKKYLRKRSASIDS